MLDVETARRSFRGELIDAVDPSYDEARAMYNAAIDRRPAAVARCVDAEDVRIAVSVAREHGLPISVRGGGHNVAGHSMGDNALAVDLRELDTVEVDAAAGLARAGGGATWAAFDAATQVHGLAAPGGTFNTTGVGGLTLGGGIGYLIGRFGLACDNLVAAQVVTVDGEIVRASADEHPDLFWALRGGGGNFGIVTQFEFRLHPITHVVGGSIDYAIEEAPNVLRAFRGLALEAPDDCSLSAYSHSAAPGSAERVVSVLVCYSGEADEPEQVRALRRLRGVVGDNVGRKPYLDLQSMLFLPPGLRHYWKGHFVSEVPDELIDATCELYARPQMPPGAVLYESIHGAAKRVPEDATAVGFRSASFNVSAIGVWFEASHDAAGTAWSRSVADAAAAWSIRGGGYLNYMSHDEPFERVRAAFGADRFARLQEIKRRYDPENVLHFNQNIPPASG